MKASRLLAGSLIPLFVTVAGCSGGGKSSTPTGPPSGGGNHNPTLSVNTSTTHLAYSGMASISATASDPDGDQLTFSYAGTGGSVSSSGPTATMATFTAGTQWGPAKVTVTVTDGNGGSAQGTANMYVRNPKPPRFCVSIGHACPSSSTYHLCLTPAEAVTLSQVDIQDAIYGCDFYAQYAGSGLSLSAGQAHYFDDIGCVVCPADPNPFSWIITVIGKRVEPDGGSFALASNAASSGYVYWDPTSANPAGCFPQ